MTLEAAYNNSSLPFSPPEEKIKTFEETGDIDFGYEIPGLARYRANFFMQKNGIGAVFREIPDKVMTAQQLQRHNTSG